MPSNNDSLHFVEVEARILQTRPFETTLGRWPTMVCDGWITPNHPRRVLRAGVPEDGISYGMCKICSASLIAAAERARRRRWREFCTRPMGAPDTHA